ncbi:MAG: ThiF family adenylyltransferase [Ignavibacteriales bacterium]
MNARIPPKSRLEGKRVTLVGLGALGSQLAISLARNLCGELDLVEHEAIEPGNTVRWALGASAWGLSKLEALTAHLQREYPRTVTRPYEIWIGGTAEDEELDHRHELDRLIRNSDLVVDACGSYDVTVFLGGLCNAAGIPMVSGYGTGMPLQGGVAALYRPGSGCPVCLEWAIHRGQVDRPPGYDDASGAVQPPGCGKPTFQAADYEIMQIGLQVMRLVSEAALSPGRGQESAVHILSFADDQGRPLPWWRAESLPVHRECGSTNEETAA